LLPKELHNVNMEFLRHFFQSEADFIAKKDYYLIKAYPPLFYSNKEFLYLIARLNEENISFQGKKIYFKSH